MKFLKVHPFFAIFTLLFTLTLGSQSSVSKKTSNNTKYFLDSNIAQKEKNECLAELRQLFSPGAENFQNLISFYMNTGKAHNNLGDVNGGALG